MKGKISSRELILRYITAEIAFITQKISALDYIISSRVELDTITNKISQIRRTFTKKRFFISEMSVKKNREYISELETGLLLVKYLYKINQGYSDNIVNAIRMHRGKHLARKEAFQFSKRSLDKYKISTKISEVESMTDDIFPITTYPNREELGPYIYNKEYVFTLQEVIHVIDLYEK